MIVVDDHHLFAALARRATGEAAEDPEQLLTTSSWYYRLARAAHDSGFVGALSRRIEALGEAPRVEVLNLLDALPYEIGILPARALVPVMAKLSESVRLNHLGAEAAASAIVGDASLLVVASSPILEGACERLGIELRVAPV